MALRVIGAGFGRTGTLSTKAALEALGFTRCYHMLEVGLHEDHPGLWRRAAAGGPVDWDELFDLYQATVDWPACAFWPELVSAYPDAKVLLTVRDPNDWCASFRETIAGVLALAAPEGFEEFFAMIHETITERTLDGRVGDDDHLIACYERHNQRVIDAVPADRLLVFDVRQGWAPLCEFLGCEVPDEEFPNVNDRAFFQAMVSGLERPPIDAIES